MVPFCAIFFHSTPTTPIPNNRIPGLKGPYLGQKLPGLNPEPFAPGMTIGEIGAGRGRYTLHLSYRVGKTGKIFANDINKSSLAHLKERCQEHNIKNIKIIHGEVDDPLLPKNALDMAIMVWVYHHLDEPYTSEKPQFKSQTGCHCGHS